VSAAGRVPVLFNAGAGTRETSETQILEAFGSDRIEMRAVAPADLADVTAELVRAGIPIIGIAGGDGTLHTAAQSMVGSDSALLPVPTGTLNNFARRAGIGTLADASRALHAAHVTQVPVGVVDDRYFLNTLTFGEYSRIVRMRERYRPFVGKWPAALFALAATCVRMRRFNVSMTIGDRTFARRTPFVWLGLGWGSFPQVHAALERRSQPDLEIAILRSAKRTAALAFMFRLGAQMLRAARPIRDRALEILHTRELLVDSSHRIDATADGEVLRLQPPVRVAIRDHALRVVSLVEGSQ
jgi:diacylglycerol kinase family enzyme